MVGKEGNEVDADNAQGSMGKTRNIQGMEKHFIAINTQEIRTEPM